MYLKKNIIKCLVFLFKGGKNGEVYVCLSVSCVHVVIIVIVIVIVCGISDIRGRSYRTILPHACLVSAYLPGRELMSCFMLHASRLVSLFSTASPPPGPRSRPRPRPRAPPLRPLRLLSYSSCRVESVDSSYNASCLLSSPLQTSVAGNPTPRKVHQFRLYLSLSHSQQVGQINTMWQGRGVRMANTGMGGKMVMHVSFFGWPRSCCA